MNTLTLANVAEGTYAGNLTRVASAVLSSRYLLVKVHTTAGEVALCGISDSPLGIATDEAEAIGDPVNVALLGSASSTLKAIASATIAEGALLCPAANGQVRALPASAGNYLIIGRALKAASTNGIVEFDPCLPSQYTV